MFFLVGVRVSQDLGWRLEDLERDLKRETGLGNGDLKSLQQDFSQISIRSIQSYIALLYISIWIV